jgi:hypothetical protein
MESAAVGSFEKGRFGPSVPKADERVFESRSNSERGWGLGAVTPCQIQMLAR